jgi:hypothetical protein
MLGFDGPHPGGRHEFMRLGDATLHIPSYREYDVGKLREVLNEVGAIVGQRITSGEWQAFTSGRKPAGDQGKEPAD